MRTNVCKSICPNCGAVDHEQQLTYTLVDMVLSVTNKCSICDMLWSNHYGLFYLGYADKERVYDMDGLEIRY